MATKKIQTENVAYLTKLTDKTISVLRGCAENLTFGAVGEALILVNISELEEYTRQLGGATSKELKDVIALSKKHNFVMVEI